MWSNHSTFRPSSHMSRALVALGSNLGDRSAILARAIERIARIAVAGSIQASRPRQTAPAGGPAGQEPFLNAAISFQTSLSPHSLLAKLRAIETELGRVRGERWGARLIDLDILLYNNAPRTAGNDAPQEPLVVADAELQIPHPRMAFRRFALEPAAEAAPEMIHPIFGRTVKQLLDHLNHSPPLVAILGGTAAERNALAQAVAAQTGAACILDPSPAASSSPNDSSGRSPASPLQFRDDTARLLSQHDWNSPEWVVSALSAQQAFAEGLARISSASVPVDFLMADYESLNASLGPLTRPRLLVVLDDWSELVALHLGDRPQPGKSVRQIALYAASTSETPVLCAGRTDFKSQLNEITAALVAME